MPFCVATWGALSNSRSDHSVFADEPGLNWFLKFYARFKHHFRAVAIGSGVLVIIIGVLRYKPALRLRCLFFSCEDAVDSIDIAQRRHGPAHKTDGHQIQLCGATTRAMNKRNLSIGSHQIPKRFDHGFEYSADSAIR